MQRPKIPHYYGRLKVAPDAPPEVIRAAYKALVQKYHPDRHHGSVRHEVVLAALNKAQDVLLDPQRRAAHDQWIRDEEVRLGYRRPQADDELAFSMRLKLLWYGIREGELSWGAAWRVYLTQRQRLALLSAGVALCGLLLGGVLMLFLPTDDRISGGLPVVFPKTVSAARAASAPP
eukprot:TRINITY_DN2115_c0_g1_i5.p1 TRINITY_DN2115_c0_g1~~TRINITY_DN2115_c0_g1_i5.p1  ORF type:complete len:176 (-),score=25.54 TRINITY_DN2115_c0_g1_i5:111-638(-)